MDILYLYWIWNMLGNHKANLNYKNKSSEARPFRGETHQGLCGMVALVSEQHQVDYNLAFVT